MAIDKTTPLAVSEWWHGYRIITGDELATYERRAAARFAPRPDNVIDLEHERIRRTAGGKVSWQAVIREPGGTA